MSLPKFPNYKVFFYLINFVEKWITNMASTTTKPFKKLLIYKSTRNANIRDLWGDSQQTAFNSLKTSLSNNSRVL